MEVWRGMVMEKNPSVEKNEETQSIYIFKGYGFK